jgi:hypothetical protein
MVQWLLGLLELLFLHRHLVNLVLLELLGLLLWLVLENLQVQHLLVNLVNLETQV